MMNQSKEHSNREKAVRLSAEFLRDAGIALFPLNIERMLKGSLSRQIHICPYSSMNKSGSSDEKEQTVDPRQLSKDGFCMRVKGTLFDFGTQSFAGDMWNIFYNDASLSERIRFTLLHELGHVFMGHHQLLDIDSTSEFENTPEYREVDEQADLFAINALAPAPAIARLLREHGFALTGGSRELQIVNRDAIFLRNLGQDPKPVQLIVTAFGISQTAAVRRLSELNQELKIWEKLDPSLYTHIEQIGHRSGWYCWVCHTRRRTSSLYCTGCGNGWSYEYKDFGHPSRPVMKLKENGQFAFCSVCGNSNYPDDAGYCPICGAPVFNECLNSRYTDGDFIRSGRIVVRGTHHCRPTDIYCGTCGVLTAFGENHGPRKNLWLRVSGSDHCRFAETTYPPVFETEDGMLKACPACGSERSIRDGRYCADCMQPLQNCCTGGKDGTHACMPNDRYCPVCGQPTLFKQSGFLTDYTNTKAYRLLLEKEKKSHSQTMPQMIIHSDGSWQLLNREEA